MQSSCVLCFHEEEEEELAAGSRTVYRRYLRKFICVIPRVHGGYFKSSSCVIHRVHQERLQQFLSGDGFFQTSGSWQRSFVGEDRPRKPDSHCSQDCRNGVWATAGGGMFFGRGHSGDCIGSPQVASGCYSLQEWRHDEVCSIRRCTRWSKISRSRSSKDRNSRSFWRREATPETALAYLGWLPGYRPHVSRDADPRSILPSPAAGCTNWNWISRNRVGWQQTSNFLQISKVRTTGADLGLTWTTPSKDDKCL